MPTTDAEDIQSLKDSVSNGAKKLERKYLAAADKTLDRLKDPDTQEAWESAMADEQTKKAYEAGRENVSKSDLEKGMKQKGKQNYLNSMGSEVTIEKWAKNSKDYRDAYKDESASAPIAKTYQERKAKATHFMDLGHNMKRKKLGLSEET